MYTATIEHGDVISEKITTARSRPSIAMNCKVSAMLYDTRRSTSTLFSAHALEAFSKEKLLGRDFSHLSLLLAGLLIWVGGSEIKDVTGVPLSAHWVCAGQVRVELHTTLQWWAGTLKDSSVNVVGFGQYRRYLRTQAWKVLGFVNLARERLAHWQSWILAKQIIYFL
jgi:hypothetical protein